MNEIKYQIGDRVKTLAAINRTPCGAIGVVIERCHWPDVRFGDTIQQCDQKYLELVDDSNLQVDQDTTDPVNHPPHYQGKVECIDAIESALGTEGFIAYCRGNAIKYIFRAGKKGDEVEDLSKAIWYLERILKTKKEVN
jgi:hypothetical protein